MHALGLFVHVIIGACVLSHTAAFMTFQLQKEYETILKGMI